MMVVKNPTLFVGLLMPSQKLYNKIFSRGVEFQSKNRFFPTVVESLLHVTTTHKTRKSRCHINTQPQDVNTFERLQLYAFKGD
jgi:hypothetical protein